MRTFNVIKLGTVCTDMATNLVGTLTHWMCDMEGNISYFFQPRGLNPDDGKPLKQLFLERARLVLPDGCMEEVNVPFEILGTQVEDKASGFKGMAVSFIRHLNGCFHIYIQPSDLVARTNTPVQQHDFDLRSCTGPMITQLNEAELAASHRDTPSPMGDVITRDLPASVGHHPHRG